MLECWEWAKSAMKGKERAWRQLVVGIVAAVEFLPMFVFEWHDFLHCLPFFLDPFVQHGWAMTACWKLAFKYVCLTLRLSLPNPLCCVVVAVAAFVGFHPSTFMISLYCRILLYWHGMIWIELHRVGMECKGQSEWDGNSVGYRTVCMRYVVR